MYHLGMYIMYTNMHSLVVNKVQYKGVLFESFCTFFSENVEVEKMLSRSLILLTINFQS